MCLTEVCFITAWHPPAQSSGPANQSAVCSRAGRRPGQQLSCNHPPEPVAWQTRSPLMTIVFVLLIIFPIGLTFLKLKENLKEKLCMSQVFPYFRFIFHSFNFRCFFFFFITARAECGRETKNAVQIKDMGPSWIPYYAFPEKTFNRTRGWNAQSESQPTFPLIAHCAAVWFGSLLTQWSICITVCTLLTQLFPGRLAANPMFPTSNVPFATFRNKYANLTLLKIDKHTWMKKLLGGNLKVKARKQRKATW